MNLAALLVKAQKAKPEESARPRKWAKLWPSYVALRSRGFSCTRAVKWLVAEGAIPKDESERALNAFHIMATRRNKKTQNA